MLTAWTQSLMGACLYFNFFGSPYSQQVYVNCTFAPFDSDRQIVLGKVRRKKILICFQRPYYFFAIGTKQLI